MKKGKAKLVMIDELRSRVELEFFATGQTVVMALELDEDRERMMLKQTGEGFPSLEMHGAAPFEDMGDFAYMWLDFLDGFLLGFGLKAADFELSIVREPAPIMVFIH